MYKLIKMLFIAGSLMSISMNAVIADTAEIPNTKHRAINDVDKYPWSAIGTVNWAGISIRASCTGTLIAEDLVLTAAHCLYNTKTDKNIGASLIHFSAGYRRGKYLAHSKVKQVFRDPAFKLEQKVTDKLTNMDWAILQLEKPIGRKTGYLGWSIVSSESFRTPLFKEGTIFLAGYPRDRAHILSLDTMCRLSMDARDSLYVKHSCKTVEGDSGGPLAILYKGHATIIGINSSTSTDNVNRAVTLKSAQKHLQNLLNASKPINKKAAINFTKGRPPEEVVQ